MEGATLSDANLTNSYFSSSFIGVNGFGSPAEPKYSMMQVQEGRCRSVTVNVQLNELKMNICVFCIAMLGIQCLWNSELMVYQLHFCIEFVVIALSFFTGKHKNSFTINQSLQVLHHSNFEHLATVKSMWHNRLTSATAIIKFRLLLLGVIEAFTGGYIATSPVSGFHMYVTGNMVMLGLNLISFLSFFLFVPYAITLLVDNALRHAFESSDAANDLNLTLQVDCVAFWPVFNVIELPLQWVSHLAFRPALNPLSWTVASDGSPCSALWEICCELEGHSNQNLEPGEELVHVLLFQADRMLQSKTKSDVTSPKQWSWTISKTLASWKRQLNL